jgi:hypothetical protein
MNLTADDELFIKAIRDVVADAGEDFTYPDEWRHLTPEEKEMGLTGCRYVADGQPACLIARALARMGVTTAELADYEGSSAESVMEAHGEFSLTIREAADSAQTVQDAGRNWGQALLAFDRYLVRVAS